MSSIKAGETYVLKDIRTGKVLDLSGSDGGVALLGRDFHGADNQLWVFEQRDGGMAIRSKSQPTKYIVVDGAVATRAFLVGKVTDKPQVFEIRPSADGASFQMFVEGTTLIFDLIDGNATADTPSPTSQGWKATQE